jgi:serine/threonine-protein phosphatase 5
LHPSHIGISPSLHPRIHASLHPSHATALPSPPRSEFLTHAQLLWTDPQDQPGRGPSKRGVGLGFGPDVTRRWCELNRITAVIRSHEVRAEGYAVEHDGLCITTFSCPNYCDSQGNKGAYVHMRDDGELSYHAFGPVPHPDVRPMAYASGFTGMM